MTTITWLIRAYGVSPKGTRSEKLVKWSGQLYYHG